jgi:hypothetical protein
MLFKVILSIFLAAQGYCASWRVNGVESSVSSTPSALTNEQDRAAFRAYHYGSPDIIESPDSWFLTDGAGMITNFLYQSGRENVVIPWKINGVAITEIGEYAFTYYDSGLEFRLGWPSLNSVICPKSVTIIRERAFAYSGISEIKMPGVLQLWRASFLGCLHLTSVELPSSLVDITEDAFRECFFLTSVTFLGNIPTIGPNVYYNADNVTNYVSSTSTGWGSFFGDRPVVRKTIFANNVIGYVAVGVGPVINSVQSYLTSNGTNLFFVNVNSQTNAITSN